MEGEEVSDDALLARVAADDAQALRRLMDRHAPRLLVLAERTAGSADDADDVVQEAFVKLWEKAPDWSHDGPARLSTWLYRIVLNGAIDRRRRRRHDPLEQVATLPDGRGDALVRAAERQRDRLVRALLGELPDRQAAALTLYYFGELSAPEAAAVLGVSLSAMEALLVRGRKALRRALVKRGVTDLGVLE